MRSWLLGTFAAAAMLLTSGAPAARDVSTIELLDRYASGGFATIVEALSGEISYENILNELRRDAAAWIDAKGPAERPKRVLAAATFALEAARAGAWHEWKVIRKQPKMCAANNECYQPPNVLTWKAPPLLIEWGCRLLRDQGPPAPIERWWQLAALAVAQRAEDPQFLIGDPKVGLGIGAGEIANTQDEIKHLDHAFERFPEESRFALAQGIARERDMPGDAAMAYRRLAEHPDVGGEALVRLGVLQLPQRRATRVSQGDAAALKQLRSPQGAVDSFERAEQVTRDPFVVFLARYFKAQVYEQLNRRDRALTAYRGAADAVPHAPSATVALAALLFEDGRRTESQELVRDMIAAQPPPLDPWRAYAHADDRFWRRLVGRLREEILR